MPGGWIINDIHGRLMGLERGSLLKARMIRLLDHPWLDGRVDDVVVHPWLWCRVLKDRR